MQRNGSAFLNNWLMSPDRKPLVIRGARQVGKTWLVRNLAITQNRELIELNFEKRPELATLFAPNEPAQILLNLSSIAQSVDPKKNILFLDEIQVAPELLAKLRWFAEDMPDLPVIAAGSLLEFTLSKYPYSMPVGRINYMHLEPLSFEEFLVAQQKQGLLDYIKAYNLSTEIPLAIHKPLLSLFKEYIIVGGMPQAVASWAENRSLKLVSQIHQDLLATYRDDFTKYHGRLNIDRLDEVITAIPRHLGKKIVYSKVSPQAQSTTVKYALDLLSKARVCHKIYATSANGVPLGAELLDKYLKVIFLDVGLCSSILGYSLDQFMLLDDIDLINKGGIAEQVTGQILRTITPFFVEPILYYWQRTEKGSSAEIDYVIQYTNKVIPIEVKAGSTGTLKSLHFFMALKKLPIAVRINSDLPYQTAIKIKDQEETDIRYTLLSIPFYLLGQLHRLLNNVNTTKSEHLS